MRTAPKTPAALLMLATAVLAAGSLARAGAPEGTGWLDRPLTNWNRPGSALPQAPRGSSAGELLKRCPPIGPQPSSAAARQLSAAGWLPFLPLDREIVQGDIEILGGMSNADGMCRPLGYQLFVFAGGTFAGTLSPQLMDSRTDQSSGPLRILEEGVIQADFSRFTSSDALCCPSGHLFVRYRIDRQPGPPLVVPADVGQRVR
jgi:LppP/LprE lipoprotein